MAPVPTSKSPAEVRAGGRTGPWPYAIAGGLGLVIAVNVYVAHLASQDPPITESDRPYEAGEAYEGELQSWRASAALGYAAQVAVESGAVVVRLTDAHGAPVRGLTGNMQLARNERTDRDQTVTVTETDPGVYVGRGDLALGGVWRVKSKLSDARGTWLDDRRLWVQP